MTTPLPTTGTAGTIINRTAAEVGIEPVTDPYSSQDPQFIQLRYLLDSVGEEMVTNFQWEALQQRHQVITQATDTGKYPLPEDFAYMMNQTGWEESENVPLFGPLSPQDWSYLRGRDLVSYTIYASFRLAQGEFWLFPQPPPDGLDVNFEYISKNWVRDADDANLRKDSVTKNGDIPLFHRGLMIRAVKVMYLEAKQLDSTKARDSLNQFFVFLTGQNQGAEVISAGRNRRGFPYLDTYANTPDTNYGAFNAR